MKTKLLYVLVSNERDIYLEQGYVSMFSAKMHMPDCHITILTDKTTYETLNKIRKEETKYADEIIIIDLDPTLPSQKRSRLLKTNARNYVSGDFLFIDSDTIIIKDLSEIDMEKSIISACWDTHSDFSHNPYRYYCIRDVKKFGIDISHETEYFNSGVMFVRDNEFNRNFYKLWNDNYLRGYEKGISMDQPSLEVTNIQLRYPLHKLDDKWNCELKHGIRYLKDAYIVHYLCTNPSKSNDTQLFILNERNIFLEIKESGLIPSRIIEVIKDPFKGIAPITHCFAGNEIFFFHTKTYSMIIKRYLNNDGKMIIESILQNLSKIKNKCESIASVVLKNLIHK